MTFDPYDHFECVTSRRQRDWIVRRIRDGRVMTNGDVIQCTRWMRVWGPMKT